MSNEENRRSSDFLREQDEKRQRAIKEMQDLQSLLDYASGKAEKPNAAAETPKAAPQAAPKAAPRPLPKSTQPPFPTDIFDTTWHSLP